MSARRSTSDRNLLLILVGVMLLVVVGVGFLSRNTKDQDSRPTTYNTGPLGAKAAFLMLQELGRNVQRWDQATDKLDSVDAANTTLVLAEPTLRMDQQKHIAAALQRFLNRGGRVLLTGATWASLLPGGRAGSVNLFSPKICYTTPEGPGELALAGQLEMADQGGWTATGPQFRIAQRCMASAVVVSFPVGRGEAIWWSSATPLTNAGLSNDANLKLLLASLYGNGGQHRAVLFDEYLHNEHGAFHPLAGLPMGWLLAQIALIFCLLVLSFSRRKGPLRLPVSLPRGSPVEFAESMGDLYEKAGATSAATDAARRRLLRLLQRDAGVPRSAIDAGPEEVAAALQQRMGGDWSNVAAHLDDAQQASSSPIAPRSALALVRALAADEAIIRDKLKPASLNPSPHEQPLSELSEANADSESLVEV